jgi:ribosomal-protein-alanine N-acetyltransferase
VGDCAFTNIVRGPFQACHLGYKLDQKFVGRGLMREGLTSAIDHAFHALKLHRIMANYQPTNERSGRLLRRLGFTIEGYARDYLFLNGGWRDHILTSLVNPNIR